MNPTELDNRTHIMLVEDDESLAEWFTDFLTEQGYLVTLATRGDEAVHMIQADQPDLVILDIMLPVKDGFDVCKEVRPFYQRPILMMTARNDEIDEVLGLELGANDYLTKPVKPRVLLARIKVLLRQTYAGSQPGQVQEPVQEPVQSGNKRAFGGFKIDANSRSVSLNNNKIVLSSNEFEVLWMLAESADQVISRQTLVTRLRGIEYDGFDRSMDMLVSRLRKKLKDDPTKPNRIKTVWSKGYMLATDAW